MAFNLLQTQPTDTLNIQLAIDTLAEKLSTTPVTVLVSELIDKAVAFGLKVLAALFIYSIGIWIIRRIRNILSRLLSRKNTDAGISSFVQSLVGIILNIILLVITIGAVGIDTTSIAALLAGGGMAIGMALNGTVQNFAGGIMLVAFKPFKVGDYIEAQGYEGTVTEISIVSTKLMTADNRCIIIPNGALSNGTINNFSHNTIRRVEWTVCVEYGVSAEECKRLLNELLERDLRILRENDGAPADPFVGLSILADSSVNFTMRAWVKKENYWPVKFEMNEKIYETLPKHGIHFPFPQMDVHVHQDK
jgi:small conductance mechanosensitive channel